jgi:hypothetical protein
MGSTRVSRVGERVLAIADFFMLGGLQPQERPQRLFRRDAAATDAKQRPGFPTSARDACATLLALIRAR